VAVAVPGGDADLVVVRLRGWIVPAAGDLVGPHRARQGGGAPARVGVLRRAGRQPREAREREGARPRSDPMSPQRRKAPTLKSDSSGSLTATRFHPVYQAQ